MIILHSHTWYCRFILGLRLVGGYWKGEGRVEILYNGVWGTVCDDSWDISDARVVCRELGYPDAVSAPHIAHFGQGSGPIWLDNVFCSGNEKSIVDCGHNGWGVENCGHNEDASVICSSEYNLNIQPTHTLTNTLSVALYCLFVSMHKSKVMP